MSNAARAPWDQRTVAQIASEVRRLRNAEGISAQALADRISEMGPGISRSVVADIENGRRNFVTITELMLLARALNTAPILLVYPGPYRDKTEFLPGAMATQMWALKWFSAGLVGWGEESVSDDSVSHERDTYQTNVRRFRKAEAIWELEEKLAYAKKLIRHAAPGDEAAIKALEESVELAATIRELDTHGG